MTVDLSTAKAGMIASWDYDEGDCSIYEHSDGDIIKLFLPDPDCSLETFEEFKERVVLAVAAPDLLEVVEAMANFDGRNNNSHLKEMARKLVKKIKG